MQNAKFKMQNCGVPSGHFFYFFWSNICFMLTYISKQQVCDAADLFGLFILHSAFSILH